MGKYQNTLNMDADNSASLILRRITHNSKVLEFGPGNGYMTIYLSQTLNCETYIVELDSEDIQSAINHTKGYLIGSPAGDIENYFWTYWDQAKSCDHIIFADVLEHLNNPWKVLKESVSLLKDNGTILISVPNIAHNSVIIDLLNNKFDYKELGLLDNTHLRFFTRNSLSDMVKNCGLRIKQEFNTYCAIEHTEFNNKLEDIPAEYHKLLTDRPDGILYQFVWELEKDI